MNNLTSQELKANPVAGYYRWKSGDGTTYHSGIARVFCEDDVWVCETL